MIDSFLALDPTVTLPFLFMAVLLSSGGAPVPGAIALLFAGALIEAGELNPLLAGIFALSGAVTGDQLGYQIGYRAGHLIEGRLAKNPARAKKISRAKAAMRKRGGLSIYFSRWLLTPLGPTINLIAGAGNMPWSRFTFWSVIGELTWVCVLIPVGYIFSSSIEKTAYIVGDAIWMITAGFVALVIGYQVWLFLNKRNSGS